MKYYAKFMYPNNGRECDREHIKKLGIKKGIFYEVKTVSIGQSSTTIYLKDFPNTSFNSVNFTFYNSNKKKINILESKEFNHYLQWN